MTRLKTFIHVHAGAARSNMRAALERSIHNIEKLAQSDQADEEDRQAAIDEVNKLHKLMEAVS